MKTRFAAPWAAFVVLAIAGCATHGPGRRAARPEWTAAVADVGRQQLLLLQQQHARPRRPAAHGRGDKRPSRHARSRSAAPASTGTTWRAYFSPTASASYSFVGDNEVALQHASTSRSTRVMMMDCSQCPIHPQLKPMFFEYAASTAPPCARMAPRRSCSCPGPTRTSPR